MYLMIERRIKQKLRLGNMIMNLPRRKHSVIEQKKRTWIKSPQARSPKYIDHLSLSSQFVSSSSPSGYSHGKDKHEDSASTSREAGRSNTGSKGRDSMKLAVVLKGDNKQRPIRTVTLLLLVLEGMRIHPAAQGEGDNERKDEACDFAFA